MNKQAITFFSLFSLILVLSVYYVMIPPLEMTDETNITEEVSIQDQLEQKREDIQTQQQEILASSNSTGEQINDALAALSEAQESSSIETKVTEALVENGYEDVFCEISQKIIKITITKKDANSTDAANVMGIVLEKCNQKYTPEIKFIDE